MFHAAQLEWWVNGAMKGTTEEVMQRIEAAIMEEGS